MPFTPEQFLSTIALVGVVIVLSALLSGFVERSGLPQIAVFLALGAVIGPSGLNIVDVGLNSPILHAVATLSLVLVLFTDAVSLNLADVRKQRFLAFLMIGPGTIVSALLIALCAWGLLGLSPAAALILGAALASTDPVMLRGLLGRPGISPSVRQALRLEGGMNDAVLLPMVLIGMTLGKGQSPSASEWAHLALNIVILSPAAGAIVGLGAVGMLELVRKRIGVRRDYESIYSLGVAFAAFAAAESVHGSGFLAAFAAGLIISYVDVELCDCFLEYGETTAEMALMFTFVLFGVSTIWSGLGIIGASTLLFVAAVLLARAAAFIPALLPSKLSWTKRLLIAWFGPRGLSSLLLILLPLFAGMPGSEKLVTICCLVVLCSVVLHGLSPSILVKAPPPAEAPRPETPKAEIPKAEPPFPVAILGDAESTSPARPGAEFISLAEVKNLQASPTPPVIVDARSERSYNDSDEWIPGSVRVDPEGSVRTASEQHLPKNATLAVLCA
jgi:NhaP-type Na+/H+ or K+/H+ antiporter